MDRAEADFVFRPARANDAATIARLHVAVWRRTYRDLAPAEAHAALDETLRRRRWEEILAAPESRRSALIVESSGDLAGFGLAGPASDSHFGGRAEVKFLYVDNRFQRRGLGRALLDRMRRAMAAAGFPGIALAVVVGNDRAIAFYEALGGRQIGRMTDPGPLWRSENLIYAWDGL
jgi:ribosomal protein S18 acetylase RimI-like enzyme